LEQYRLLRRVLSLDVVKPLGVYEHAYGDGALPVLALEHVDGKPLRDQPPMSVAERLGLLERTANALAALHAAGIKHGDFHPGNVLVAGNRVVIIDPDAARWGTTRSSSIESSTPRKTYGQFSADDDLAALGDLIRFVMDDDSSATDWITEKLCSMGTRPDASEVAEHLRLTREWLPVPSLADLQGLSQWTAKESDGRHDLYNLIRRTRDEHLRRLFMDVENAAHALKLKTESIGHGDDLSREAATDNSSKGRFLARSIHCVTRDDDRWTIDLPAVPEFRKPLPPSETPNVRIIGLVSSMTSQVIRNGAPASRESLYVYWNEQTRSAEIRTGSIFHSRPIDSTSWILRHLQILTGARLCGLHGDQQLKQDRTQPVDRLTVQTGGTVMTGVDALRRLLVEAIEEAPPPQQSVRRTLVVRTPVQMSRIFDNQVFEDREKIVESLTRQIFAVVNGYANVWDVDFIINDERREVVVEIAIFPNGTRGLLAWSFTYRSQP
jgi:hypothetical protein